MDGPFFEVQKKRQTSRKAILGAAALLLLVGAIAAVALLSPSSPTMQLRQFQIEEEEFARFKAKYNKSYSTPEEDSARFQIFRENLSFIRVSNQDGNSHILGVNEFADMTFAEFRNLYLPYRIPAREPSDDDVFSEGPYEYPSSVDWRDHGAVTGVKNQGQCGSCWAFSTTGSLEGAWKLSGQTLVSLSEQELVDCSKSYGNNGCEGGLMDYGFEYVKSKGLALESTYPYTARDGSCDESKVSQKALPTINSYKDVAQKNKDALLSAAAIGPVSVAVEADQSAWQFYYGGIVKSGCGVNLDHGVLVVGYSTEGSTPYWIVKNSWGSYWGESGYIRLEIQDGDGICGINLNASYPIIN